MKREYTRGATEDFLQYLRECGPVSRADLDASGWWSRIHSRLPDLVKGGVVNKEQMPNVQSGERYARTSVTVWGLGSVPYVRVTGGMNLTREGADKGRQTRSAQALKRRIETAILFLESNGYVVVRKQPLL